MDGGLQTPIEQRETQHCSSGFLLCDVQVNKPDKLGNVIREVLWCGIDYVVYKTDRGVFVNFSDCANREKEQRSAFTAICPELCELRCLTHEMHEREESWLQRLFPGRRRPKDKSSAGSLFDHNIAQALMLLMEGKHEDAKSIAAAALQMAVKRATNDNTIRYVGASIVATLAASLPLAAVYYAIGPGQVVARNYLLAAFAGVLGGMFSVATRVSSFQAKPCQQSNMNYVMARLRICIGLISAVMLYLAVGRLVGGGMINTAMINSVEGAAIIGFLGGFAERLVPTVFRRAAEAVEEASGTPVQLARVKAATSAQQAG